MRRHAFSRYSNTVVEAMEKYRECRRWQKLTLLRPVYIDQSQEICDIINRPERSAAGRIAQCGACGRIVPTVAL